MSYVVNVLGGFVGLVMLITWIGGTIWVLIDARKNSSQSAVLWALVVFFGAILRLLRYVLLGRNTNTAVATNKDHDQPDRSAGQPSHRCESRGEEYHTNPSVEISTCRTCGGVNVSQVA